MPYNGSTKATLTAGERRLVQRVLKSRFPQLGTDFEINGADAVDTLVELYGDLGDTGKLIQIPIWKSGPLKPKPLYGDDYV